MAPQRIEIIISELDFYLINKIKELREKAQPPVAQNKLSRELGLAEGYISKVENFKERARYNIWILNKIGKILKLDSFNELFPDNFFQNDVVKIQLEYYLDKNSTRKFKILSKTSLTEIEMENWKRNKLQYCRRI